MNYLLLVCFFIISAFQIEAKPFSNEYIQFELPPGWECSLEGAEWLCQSENKDRKKEAIIIMAAKIRGAQDNLANYQAYLQKKKTYKLPGGKTQASEFKYAKLNSISAHQWVDALHLASEVPGFYTRYLATVKEDLGVAVTFSVAMNQYARYQPVFNKMIASLRVFRKRKINLADLDKKAPIVEIPDIPIDDINPQVTNHGRTNQKKKKKSGGGDNLLYILIALGAAGFFVLKKRG